MGRRKTGAADVHYYSDHLQHKLNHLRASSTTIVEAPSGYGKTTAVRDYLAASLPQSTPVHWFTAVEELPEACFRRFAAELAKIDKNAGQRMQKIGLPNAATIGEACDALRSIKCRNEVFLVIDNFQYLHTEMSAAFFTALIEHGGEGVHIVLLTQMMKRNLFATAVGRNFLHVTVSDLRLEPADIRRYFSLAGVSVTQTTAEKVAFYTGGWIIAVYLQLRAYRYEGSFADTRDIMTLMENLVWENLNEKQQEFFLCLSPFEELTVSRMRTLMGWESLPDYALQALEIPFIYYAPAELRYWPHRILLDFVVLKCRERGETYEHACLARAGDLYRAEGEAEQALGYYWRIKDYERILSLDFSGLILEYIYSVPFWEIALELAQNCLDEIMDRHILSMLRIAWALLLAAKTAPFVALMDKLHEILKGYSGEDAGLLRGEWTLLSVYKSFPHLNEMNDALDRAAELLGGTTSRVIFPEAPWCFGALSQFAEFHLQEGAGDQEADALERYVSIYSKLTGGRGSGADVLFRADLAICRGDFSDAEIFAYKAAFLADNSHQGVIQLGYHGYPGDKRGHPRHRQNGDPGRELRQQFRDHIGLECDEQQRRGHLHRNRHHG